MKSNRERRCIVTGEVKTELELLRVALGPGNVLVADVSAKLPGRGAWVSAQADLIAQAIKNGAFSRAFERKVNASEDLIGQFKARLEAMILSQLGLARRAGRLAIGFDGVKLALSNTAKPAFRIEACDGADDGRRKLDRLANSVWPGLSVIDYFTAAQLGQRFGRDHLVHAVLIMGSEAKSVEILMGKRAGF